MPTLSVPQANVFQCNKRFRVLIAGRRFGKTYLSVAELLRGASWPGFTAWYVAPTYRQAKQIAWRRLKELARPLIVKTNETDLAVELSTGGIIALRGADNYDSLRGVGLDGVVLDEFADIAPEVWNEVLRPALSDRLGWALFIGTPKGYNFAHKTYVEALDKPDWAAFKYTTLEGGQVPLSEVIAAKAELDPKTFRQEYEASFETTGVGKLYYGFAREENVKPVYYDPALPLMWSMDFNVSPMCSVICQMRDNAPNIYTSNQNLRELFVLDEICLEDSNIPQSCDEFKRRALRYVISGRTLQVNIYADSSGNARTHAGATDFQVIKQQFAGDARFHLSWHTNTSNPEVKDRVNAVNALILSADGRRRLTIDPRCKELITDLEQVVWKMDSAGNSTGLIDKRDGKRSHSSDALGYLVEKEFPLNRTGSGYKNTRLI